MRRRCCSGEEHERLDAAEMSRAPPYVAGDYPEWLDPHFGASFGEARAEEGAALASRAPLDLRTNTLKRRARNQRNAWGPKPEPTRWSPWGLRVRLSADAKSPAIHAEPAFLKGLVEVQDEGSQVAALLSAAKPGEQVVDLCAGAGGKTLAMAAMMQNKGQIFATDDDKRRLAPIHDRLKRSGARNVQVRTPKSVGEEIDDLAGRMDLVLIDAPCTGTGAWRRNPDAKWRMRPGALEQRQKEQTEVLDRAVSLRKSWWPHCLRHLLGSEGRERRPSAGVPGAAFGICGSASGGGYPITRGACLHVRQGGVSVGPRYSDDSARNGH